MEEKTRNAPGRTTMAIVLLLGGFAVTFAETLLNTAIPAIMRETHVSRMSAQWLNTAYMLAAGIVMPLAARFIARFRLRPLFTWVMSLFLFGDVIALFAPNFNVHLTGRIIQALAVGVMLPLDQSVIVLLYPARRRGFALGLFGIVTALGPAVGPTVSGWIVDRWSWRVLFGILAPVCVLVIIFGLIFVRDVTDTRRQRVDWLSVFLSSLGLGLLLDGCGEVGAQGGFSLRSILCIAVGATLTGWFAVRQLHLPHPMLRLDCFRAPSFALACVLAFLQGISLLSPDLVIPLSNQTVVGVSAMESGLIMLPGALLMSALSPISGIWYDRLGMRLITIGGYTLTLAATTRCSGLGLRRLSGRSLFSMLCASRELHSPTCKYPPTR